MPSSDFSFADSGIFGTGQFLAGPFELAGTGVGVGFAVGLGEAVGGELAAEVVGAGEVSAGSTGSACPTHPVAETTSAPEQATSRVVLNFPNMPEPYDSLGAD